MTSRRQPFRLFTLSSKLCHHTNPANKGKIFSKYKRKKLKLQIRKRAETEFFQIQFLLNNIKKYL
jgi:hypothetical protein